MDTSADTGNHLLGYSYDAGGNMTGDGLNTYVYDGENRISSVAGVSYTYDVDGRRVKKSSGTNYWYGPSGEALAETDSAGTWTNYVFFAGQRLARNVNGDIKYYITDHLHSTAVFADKSGTVLDDNDFYPWGGVVPGVGQTTSNNTIKFTGKYRDTESGLDYFGARYYANRLGRFMSPDWAAKPVTVPYAKFGDPQSLNLYGYTENAPVNRIDAGGHSYAGFDGFMRPKGAGDLPMADVGLDDGNAEELGPSEAQQDAALQSELSVASAGGGVFLTFTPVIEAGGQCPSCHDRLHDLDSRDDNNTYRRNTQGEQGGENAGSNKATKNNGARTEPNLPKKTVVEQDGVEIKHYTRSGDHGPAHLHVEGEGPSTKIGQMGKPIKGSPELSSTQQQVVNNNKGAIRKAVDQIMRWFNFNNQ